MRAKRISRTLTLIKYTGSRLESVYTRGSATVTSYFRGMQHPPPKSQETASHTEVYDIFTKSVVYGIHSPWNYHSYKQTYLFLPQKCAMCDLTVYPSVILTVTGGSNNAESGVSCLRCHSFAHRKCIWKRTVICGSQMRSGFNISISPTSLTEGNVKSGFLEANVIVSDHIDERSLHSTPTSLYVLLDWVASTQKWDTSNNKVNKSSENPNRMKELVGKEERESARPDSEEKMPPQMEKDWAAISEQWYFHIPTNDKESHKESLCTNDIDEVRKSEETGSIKISNETAESKQVDSVVREMTNEIATADVVSTAVNDHPFQNLPNAEEIVVFSQIQTDIVNDSTPTKTYGISNNIDVALSAASPILADIGSLIMVNLNNVVATTSAHMSSVSHNINSMRTSSFDSLRRSSFLINSNTIEIVVNKYSADVDFDSIFTCDPSDLNDRTIMNIEESLPLPGSENCIWRLALIRLFKSRKKSYVLKDIPDDMIELQEIVTLLLNSSKSFSNRVAIHMHSMYIEFLFNLPCDSLRHARECLDCICSAVLSQLPENLINGTNSREILRALTTAVDKYVLSLGYKNAMYNKSFSAALMDCKHLDEALIRRYFSYDKVLELEEQDMTIEILTACDEKLLRVVQSTVASEKLGHLTHVLEVAASNDVICKISTFMDEDRTNANIESGNNEGNRERFIGADVLLQRLRFLLKRNIHLHKTNWNAEITYITAMLNDFNDIMLGKEGYSFVSLQQCVHSLNKIV